MCCNNVCHYLFNKIYSFNDDKDRPNKELHKNKKISTTQIECQDDKKNERKTEILSRVKTYWDIFYARH